MRRSAVIVRHDDGTRTEAHERSLVPVLPPLGGMGILLDCGKMVELVSLGKENCVTVRMLPSKELVDHAASNLCHVEMARGLRST